MAVALAVAAAAISTPRTAAAPVLVTAQDRDQVAAPAMARPSLAPQVWIPAHEAAARLLVVEVAQVQDLAPARVVEPPSGVVALDQAEEAMAAAVAPALVAAQSLRAVAVAPEVATPEGIQVEIPVAILAEIPEEIPEEIRAAILVATPEEIRVGIPVATLEEIQAETPAVIPVAMVETEAPAAALSQAARCK